MTDPRGAGRLRHELRTPVNHILGYAELLIEEAGDLGREDRVAALEEVRAAGRRALDLVDRIAAAGGAAGSELATRLLADLAGIAGACDLLAGGADPEGFLADLARIRTACDRLASRIADFRRSGPAPEAAA